MQVKRTHLLSSLKADDWIIFAKGYAIITRVSKRKFDFFDYIRRQLRKQ